MYTPGPYRTILWLKRSFLCYQTAYFTYTVLQGGVIPQLYLGPAVIEHFFFQPSDFSRKSTSSDSGVVSPAENAEDQQLMQRPVKPVLSVQPEKKKETDERYGAARKNTGRQTSGGSSNKNSGKQVCAPFGHKSPLE